LAKSKQEKEAIMAVYAEWLGRSKAVVLVEYTGVTMKELDVVRARMREVGGELHIVKNTLVKLALEKAGFTVPDTFVENSTAVGFAFKDAAAFAKALTESTKGLEEVKIKGGFMDAAVLTEQQVKAVASLPPLPIVRSQLLGVLQAPAGKLVRTLAEPGRSLAFVVKAHAEAAPVAA
jgi:large subunit ribosomal protein L10